MSLRAVRGIVIDAGHGGKDPGASGNGIIEKELTLDISEYMNQRFKNLGIPTKMTRTGDETLGQTERVSRVLDAFGKDGDVIVISTHINAGGGEGAEVIYPLRRDDKLASKILNEIVGAGQKGRKFYQLRLPSNPSKDYYYILRETPNTNAVIVEYGFLDTAEDAERLKENYKDYAEAVVRAVASYIGVPYSAVSGSGFYTVKKGDTLWSIATANGITVSKLKELNNLSSNELKVGDTLKIKDTEEIVVPTGYTVHVVKSGDSLWSIGKKYGVSADTIKTVNGLKSNLLTLNQELLIPVEVENESDEIIYTVKSGDTLYGISKLYGVSVEDIIKQNNLSSNNLTINQELIIPVGGVEVENPDIEYEEYIVKKGDNLYSIANKYKTTVDEIKSLNGLVSNTLSIGQTLLIPNVANTKIYIVEKGDSLYSISKKFNTSVDTIKTINGLKTNTLSIGQKLKVPNN